MGHRRRFCEPTVIDRRRFHRQAANNSGFAKYADMKMRRFPFKIPHRNKTAKRSPFNSRGFAEPTDWIKITNQ